ncbi:hypothetical protein FACS1894216_08680 [Synergistales bacterium]|nr:hypothetical protein FACS1894216_08680 [Synergistales bacterium]
MNKINKIIIRLIFLFALRVLMPDAAYADDSLIYEIRVPFIIGGHAAAIHGGGSFDLGEVVRIPDKSRWPSYTASAWGGESSVAASAVNAIHLLMSVEKEKGRTMSIIPLDTIAPAAGTDASIVIDAPAGKGLFGAWAPPVGSRVSVLTASGDIRPLDKTNVPVGGDSLVIGVYAEDMPYMVDFENRPGGRVTSWSRSDAKVIARVIRPVGGSGRFEGTLFQDGGRIRANHSGVIDVSTSPRGEIGGFQIIPWDHALTSKEMQGAWQLTQWMIIGPPDGKSEMGGTFPLFAGGLIPGTSEGDGLWDMWSTYGRRPLVTARLDGGEWQKLPNAAGRVDDALKNVTHLRIYFPTVREPLK